MKVIGILQTLLQRMPPEFMAFFVGVVFARIYVQFTKDKAIRSFLTDKLWGSFLLFVVFTRFSGLILHPTMFTQLNFYTLFGSPASNGGALGVLSIVLYLTIMLRKEKGFNRLVQTLWITRMTTLVGGVFYAYMAFLDLQPFWAEDVLRAVLGLAFFMWLLPKATLQSTHRVLGFLGGLWLITSLFVPHVNRIVLLDLGQWIGALIVLGAVTIEAVRDFRRPSTDLQAISKPDLERIQPDTKE